MSVSQCISEEHLFQSPPREQGSISEQRRKQVEDRCFSGTLPDE
jgi:hypothetical protein